MPLAEKSKTKSPRVVFYNRHNLRKLPQKKGDCNEDKFYERKRGDAPLQKVFYAYDGELKEYSREDFSHRDDYVAGPIGPIAVQESTKETITWEDSVENFDCLSGKYAIYADGEFKTDFIYDECGAYSDGLFAVSINGKWGYVDKYGNEIIPIKTLNRLFEKFQ